MTRTDIIILYIHENSVTKRQIEELFTLIQDEYYESCFADALPEREMPRFFDGKYGLWSPDIKRDLEKLNDLGVIFAQQKSNAARTLMYTVYKLTERGEEKRREVWVDASDIAKEALWQIRERLERKRHRE